MASATFSEMHFQRDRSVLIKHAYIAMNVDEIDVELTNDSVYLVDGTTRCYWNYGVDNKYNPSGIVVLNVFKIGPKNTLQCKMGSVAQ